MTEHDDFRDILTDGEGGLLAAWPLPNEGELTQEERRQAMDNFRAYTERQGIAVDDVSRRLASPGPRIIRSLLAGSWVTNTDTHVRKLNSWVEQDARSRAATLDGAFVTTGVAQAMLNIARLTAENRTMALAIGPSGIGKSRCAQAIHESYVGSVLIRIMQDCKSPTGLIRAIAAAVGVRRQRTEHDRSGIARTRLESVIQILQGSDRLLIIDEAHRLAGSPASLEVLRDIHDVGGVPIMLIGTKDLHDKILQEADADHGQLYSRFDIVQHLTQGRNPYEGGPPLFHVAEIRQLYQRPPLRLSKDAEDYLLGVANELGRGSLRRCTILLRNAARVARKRSGLDDRAAVTVTAADLEWVETRLRRESAELEAVAERRKRVAAATRIA